MNKNVSLQKQKLCCNNKK